MQHTAQTKIPVALSKPAPGYQVPIIVEIKYANGFNTTLAFLLVMGRKVLNGQYLPLTDTF